MGLPRGKDLVALAAVLGAGVYGAWCLATVRLDLDGRWTDGVREWRTQAGAGLRYAVWEDPEPLDTGVATSRPTLSPDGRFLVFASGERGLDAELLALPTGGESGSVFGSARPIAAVSSPFDELAPAFAGDALWYASDRAPASRTERGTNGLDLWRVPYAEGEFGEPELVGGGLNSSADDTDPAPLANGGVLFASLRRRGARIDHDLYRAAPDSERPGRYVVTPLAELNTPFEEREPSLTASGDGLVFASDRAGAGGFDLWRSFAGPAGWLTAAPLHELNTAADERGPAVSMDGFTLLFERHEEGAPRAWRARSREVFRRPGPGPSLLDLLLVGALLLLALLALLAKRWTAFELLYKCFLVSLLAHLLLLWLMRDVYPDSDEVELPNDGPSFRVKLAPDAGAPAAGRARGGALDLTRALEPESPSPSRAAAPAVAAAERASAPAGLALAAPSTVGAAPAPQATPAPAQEASGGAPRAVQLASHEDLPAAFRGAAPELAVAARATGARRAEREGAQPRAAAAGAPARGTEVPEVRPVDAALGPASFQPAAPGSGKSARAASSAPAGVAVSGPREEAQGASGAAPELALGAPDAGAVRAAADSAAPARARGAPLIHAAGPTRPGSLSGSALLAAQGTAARGATPSASRSAAPAAVQSAAGPELRAPATPRGPASHGSSALPPARYDPTAGLGRVATPATPRRDARPAPARVAGLSAAAPAATPERLPLAAPAVVAEAGPLPAAPPNRGLEATPYRNRFGAEKLRALDVHGGSRETEAAVAEGLAYLARIQNRNGSWGSARDRDEKYGDVRVGKTGLALLAFLGAGHDTSGALYGDNVRRAMGFLLGRQDTGSGHFGDTSAYGHAVATYALAEQRALTNDTALAAPLRSAVAQILRNQDERSDPRARGGWGYYFDDGRVWNGDTWPRVSVTAWQVMALESARLGGTAVPRAALEDAREFLLAAWDERRGAFRYSHDPARLRSEYAVLPASTPAAIFALSLLAVDAGQPGLAPARRFVEERAPRRYRRPREERFVSHAEGNLYFWYYGSLAMFRAGGDDWERWNVALKETLLPSQEEDGSWRPISPYASYAGDDDGDRSYTTAMCVLTLEVYYRYFTPLLEQR